MASRLCAWTPEVFWNATPEDLATILEIERGDDVAPPDASALARLKEAFPDG